MAPEMEEDIVFSTAYQFEFLVFMIILFSVFILYFMYYFVKHKAFRNLESFILYSKVVIGVVILILLLIMLISTFIILEITQGSEYATIVFVLVNGLLLGVYMNITFSNLTEKRNKYLKYTMLILVLFIVITDFGDIGLRIILNTDVYIPLVLMEKVYESNTPQGVRFMFLNIVILIVIFGVSFLLESKKK